MWGGADKKFFCYDRKRGDSLPQWMKSSELRCVVEEAFMKRHFGRSDAMT